MGAFDDIIRMAADKKPPAPGAAQQRVTYGDVGTRGPTAYARFSRAPITFLDLQALSDLVGETIEGTSKDPSGAYHRKGNRISVTVPQSSDVDEVLNTIRHEDVHGVLNNAGLSNADLTYPLYTAPPDVGAFFGGLRRPSSVDLVDAWRNSNRVGSFDSELPAYMTAYRPGEIKDVTKPGAEAWTKAYANTLPPDTRRQILRLENINRGAQPITPRMVK